MKTKGLFISAPRFFASKIDRKTFDPRWADRSSYAVAIEAISGNIHPVI